MVYNGYLSLSTYAMNLINNNYLRRIRQQWTNDGASLDRSFEHLRNRWEFAAKFDIMLYHWYIFSVYRHINCINTLRYYRDYSYSALEKNSVSRGQLYPAQLDHDEYT